MAGDIEPVPLGRLHSLTSAPMVSNAHRSLSMLASKASVALVAGDDGEANAESHGEPDWEVNLEAHGTAGGEANAESGGKAAAETAAADSLRLPLTAWCLMAKEGKSLSQW
jgi:hypothetical protein